jgi:hypothetical protein
MDETALGVRLKQLLVVAGVLVVVACVYVLIATFITYKSTAVLHVNSSDSRALISVGQSNHETKVAGTGKAAARLKPGTYQVMASNGRNRAVKTVKISGNQGADIFLKLRAFSSIRSVDDVNFKGISGFTDSGFTDEQLNALKLDFFRFKTSARTVAIDIDSITPGPRNPKARDPFTATFAVTIDSVPYKGLVTYSGFEDISLMLYNSQDGSVAFDSNLNYSNVPAKKAE